GHPVTEFVPTLAIRRSIEPGAPGPIVLGALGHKLGLGASAPFAHVDFSQPPVGRGVLEAQETRRLAAPAVMRGNCLRWCERLGILLDRLRLFVAAGGKWQIVMPLQPLFGIPDEFSIAKQYGSHVSILLPLLLMTV